MGLRGNRWAVRVAVVAGIAVLASGCGLLPNAGEPDAAQREAALATADWSRMVDVTIEMHDYGYRPREVRLRAGQPYRLRLANNGGVSHYFTAPEFLATVAARKAEVPHQAEVKAATFTSFEVHGRGGALDLYFIPLVRGTYRAHCHIKDHLPLGIEGTLIVE
jgi:plastocyanin